MLEASDGVTGGTHAATQKRGRAKAADDEYAPCGECALNTLSDGQAQAALIRLQSVSLAQPLRAHRYFRQMEGHYEDRIHRTP